METNPKPAEAPLLDVEVLDNQSNFEKTYYPLTGEKAVVGVMVNMEGGLKAKLESLVEEKHFRSLTAALIHFSVSGLEREFNAFIEDGKIPRSLRGYATNDVKSKIDKGGYGWSKKRKNDLLDRLDSNYLVDRVSRGEITLEEMDLILKEAIQEKLDLQKQGIYISGNKTEGVSLFDWKYEVREDKEVVDNRWRTYTKNDISILIPNLINRTKEELLYNSKYVNHMKIAGLSNIEISNNIKVLLENIKKAYPNQVKVIDEMCDKCYIIGIHIVQLKRTTPNEGSLRKNRYICIDFNTQNEDEQALLIVNNDYNEVIWI